MSRVSSSNELSFDKQKIYRVTEMIVYNYTICLENIKIKRDKNEA